MGERRSWLLGNGVAPGVRVIVVVNEKGGSGKSTVAIHVAVALIRSGQSVATIDLDASQRSFTQYIDNRLAWSRQRGIALPTPAHVCIDDDSETAEGDAGPARLMNTLAQLAQTRSRHARSRQRSGPAGALAGRHFGHATSPVSAATPESWKRRGPNADGKGGSTQIGSCCAIGCRR